MAKVQHKYVKTEWSTPGYFGRVKCVGCGFDMLGDNRVLTVGKWLTICDGCANAIAAVADGREVRMDGTTSGT